MMKIVPFELAQRLKEVGYTESSMLNYVYAIEDRILTFTSGAHIEVKRGEKLNALKAIELLGIDGPIIEAPTYIDVWLWLWRKKKFPISLLCDEHPLIMKWYPHAEKTGEIGAFTKNIFFDDPEEALAEAIDYLFENNLV